MEHFRGCGSSAAAFPLRRPAPASVARTTASRVRGTSVPYLDQCYRSALRSCPHGQLPMLALEKAHGTKPVPWLPARDRNRGGLMRYALALPRRARGSQWGLRLPPNRNVAWPSWPCLVHGQDARATPCAGPMRPHVGRHEAYPYAACGMAILAMSPSRAGCPSHAVCGG